MRTRVLTYNIHRAIGVDRRFRPERIVRILEHHEADIVLLQEVDDGVPRSRCLDLGQEIAEAAGYPHLVIGHNVTLRKGRYGNATLSRFPILRHRNISLTVGNRKKRGCQHTTLNIGRSGKRIPLEVFNLHLGLSAFERDRQMGLLVRSPEFRRIKENTGCLIAGDFNDWRSRVRPMLTEILDFESATTTGTTGRRDIKTYPSFSPTGSLDKIYYRGGISLISSRRCRLAISKVASDHIPIIGDFWMEAGSR